MKRLLLVVVVFVGFTGCAASAQTKRCASELHAQTKTNHRTSQPKPGIDPVEWENGQVHAEVLSGMVEEGVK